MPMPNYGYWLNPNQFRGSGVFHVQTAADGKVTAVKVLKSTGNTQLDANTVKLLHYWRARPGQARHIAVPFEFGRSGGKRRGPAFSTDGLGLGSGDR